MPRATPNYLTVAPDGTARAVFPGGVELPEAPGPFGHVFEVVSEVRWQRDSVTRGYIFTQANGAGSTGGSTMDIGATDTPDVSWAEVQLTSDPTGPGGKSIQATIRDPAIPDFAHIKQRLILDGAGNSSFPQWSSGNQARTVGLAIQATRFAGSFGTGATAVFNGLPQGQHLIYVTGSCYQVFAGGMGLIDVSWQGIFVGSSAVFMNETLSHRATVPLVVDLGQRVAGNYAVGVSTNGANGTNSDSNDIVQMIYVVL